MTDLSLDSWASKREALYIGERPNDAKWTMAVVDGDQASNELVALAWGYSPEGVGSRASLIAAAPEVTHAAQGLLDCLDQCEVRSGVCCCGDNMERHSPPMDCGHSPVDSGAYYTDQAVSVLRAALAKATGAA